MMAKVDKGPLAGPRPVFVDGTGIRRRWFVVFGTATSVLLAVAVAVVATGFVGDGPGHLPGLPGAPGRQEVVVVGLSDPPATPGGRAGQGRTRAGSAAPTAPGTASAAVAAVTQSPSVAAPTPSTTPGPPGHRNTGAPGQSKKK